MIMSISESLNPPSTLNLSPSDTLRLELKAWEKSFAIEHQGRKASRKDIKQHPEIGKNCLPPLSTISPWLPETFVHY